MLALSSELLQRGGLGAALRGRDASSLLPLLGFISKHLGLRPPAQTLVAAELLNSLLEENEKWIVEDAEGAEEIKPLLKKICQVRV